MNIKHTPGEWYQQDTTVYALNDNSCNRFQALVSSGFQDTNTRTDQTEIAANVTLIAAAPTMLKEMGRYLPILQRAEANPELWEQLTEGLGIATTNGYYEALNRAVGGSWKP